ncbi:MAG: ATP-dependent zinc metalloprotease FtsH [Acidimicrobiia bacterium]|nr:ATP-dependent zinc metalloprotease FtsH [Acidimicrobiia bacterium]MBV9039676.1 ATP-dependent zinc metalloprotease FtsH [Acidimicrobiia bacterium]MBV9284579.1 ATP-dependent zinc metalloprotease FtsH [Acidimicrobiia bacterium]
MRKLARSTIFYIILAVLALVLVTALFKGGSDRDKLSLTTFERKLAAGQVRNASVSDRDHEITGVLNDAAGTKYKTTYADRDTANVLNELRRSPNHPDFKVTQRKDAWWLTLLEQLLPFVLLVAVFLIFMNAMQGGGNRVMQFGKAKPKVVNKDQPKVTFADVAGADEAVEELQEIKEFLESPAKFQSMGAKIPKGVLLFGPPGTGKTLLARAVAGEAGVPFFSISGSDFVEMFVGVGASRVRDLFEQAKTNAPAIIFVDEIDAVGRHRGAGLGGGHDEREQTLNQLLVEMDGFDTRAGVILIAATNRPDILDPALLRPGRFDRQIVVDAPDLEGRRAILNVHAKGKPLAKGVDLEILARRTPGFTGADLANLMNEAALLAARRGFKEIGMPNLEEAIDRVIAGPERKSRLISEDEKRVIAYHEGGHALVGHALPNADPIHKVSIIPRGRALGWTLALPEQDKYLVTRSELRDQLAMLLGGRTAEELIFHDPTTGAQNDIERASQIARSMVTEYGMSDLIGPQQLGQKNGEVFLGRDLGHQPNYSDEVAARIDAEVRKLIDEAHAEALEILTDNRKTLDKLAKALVARETLDTPEVMEILGPVAKRPARTPPAQAPTRAPARRRVASTRSVPKPRPRPNPNPA